MQMLQMFETTVFSATSEHAIHAVVVPKRSFAQKNCEVNGEVVIHALDLKKLSLPPISASSLGPAFAALVSPSVPNTEPIAHLMAALQAPAASPNAAPITSADREFGERAAFDDLIPFEQSPIDLESLGKLAVSATGAGIGAYVGFVLAGSTPLLLITVPAGMIICGAAKGVADALEGGLRERIMRWLKGEAVRSQESEVRSQKSEGESSNG